MLRNDRCYICGQRCTPGEDAYTTICDHCAAKRRDKAILKTMIPKSSTSSYGWLLALSAVLLAACAALAFRKTPPPTGSLPQPAQPAPAVAVEVPPAEADPPEEVVTNDSGTTKAVAPPMAPDGMFPDPEPVKKVVRKTVPKAKPSAAPAAPISMTTVQTPSVQLPPPPQPAASQAEQDYERPLNRIEERERRAAERNAENEAKRARDWARWKRNTREGIFVPGGR